MKSVMSISEKVCEGICNCGECDTNYVRALRRDKIEKIVSEAAKPRLSGMPTKTYIIVDITSLVREKFKYAKSPQEAIDIAVMMHLETGHIHNVFVESFFSDDLLIYSTQNLPSLYAWSA